jgi:hypothetical protein
MSGYLITVFITFVPTKILFVKSYFEQINLFTMNLSSQRSHYKTNAILQRLKDKRNTRKINQSHKIEF